MGNIISRALVVPDLSKHSVFLWGPRRTGKSFWIRTHLPEAPLLDLLKTDTFAEYAARPSLLRERCGASQATCTVSLMPWREFLSDLWAGNLISA